MLLKPREASVPGLEEVVALAASARRRFLLFVELKCDASDDSAAPDALADAAYDVIAAEDFLDCVVFVGFDWRALARIRARAPTAQCWCTTDRLTGEVAPVLEMIAATGAQGWFAHFTDATPDNVARSRGKGLKVGAWTVNRQDDMRRLMGLDALCTDRPDLLEALL
jgi:glycerophosphoryl diester phosphodiesterase